MKKLVFALSVAAALVGCSPQQQDFNSTAQSHFETIWSHSDIAMIRIDGHLYIIGFVDRDRYGSGVRAIVHAAHCPCHTNNLNRINN